MKRNILKVQLLVTAPLALLSISCQAPTGVTAGDSQVLADSDSQPGQAPSQGYGSCGGSHPTPTPTVPGDPTKTVCDPFGSGNAESSDHGLVAKLWYLPNGYVGEYDGVMDFERKAELEDVTLYFNQLNVPTRMFNQGFATADGSLLKTPDGNTLYEFFALRFDSVIKLGPNDLPGMYQFAVLSDDGSILQVQQDPSGFAELVDNDEDHASKFGCARTAIPMDSNTRLPIQLDYFQGPRYNMALMLLWRRVADLNGNSVGSGGDDNHDRCENNGQNGSEGYGLSDPACGTSGNDLFFDPSQQPSTPQPNWIDILSRGWTVVAPGNFYLPDPSSPNPCVNPAPTPTPAPAPSPTTTVCAPFGGSGGGSGNGLVASLTYMPDNLPLTEACSPQDNYHCSGMDVAALLPGAPNVVSDPVTVYLNQIDQPTEAFCSGFRDNSGNLLTDEKGAPLTTYFMLQVQGQIMLNPSDAEGDYQFGLLTDDGSILYIDPSATGNYQEWIDNDGAHSNALGCAANTVHLKPGVPLPIKIDYFQGPAYEIAFVLLWRKAPSTNIAEPDCGVVEGNNYFFNFPNDGSNGRACDPSAVSTPTSNYLALYGRGWSEVPSANFYLPQQYVPNPCITPAPTPTATGTPAPTPTATSTPTPTPTATSTPTPTPTATGTPTPTPTATGTPTPTPTATSTPTPTATGTPAPSPTPTCSGPFCNGSNPLGA